MSDELGKELQENAEKFELNRLRKEISSSIPSRVLASMSIGEVIEFLQLMVDERPEITKDSRFNLVVHGGEFGLTSLAYDCEVFTFETELLAAIDGE